MERTQLLFDRRDMRWRSNPLIKLNCNYEECPETHHFQFVVLPICIVCMPNELHICDTGVGKGKVEPGFIQKEFLPFVQPVSRVRYNLFKKVPPQRTESCTQSNLSDGVQLQAMHSILYSFFNVFLIFGSDYLSGTVKVFDLLLYDVIWFTQDAAHSQQGKHYNILQTITTDECFGIMHFLEKRVRQTRCYEDHHIASLLITIGSVLSDLVSQEYPRSWTLSGNI